MIDFDLEIKHVQPINIKNMELNQYRINNNIRKSIILYNKSIAEIKTNNFDIAVNDLKTALSYNRGFSEAIRLLGLCYIHKKKYGRAEKTFKKLAKYEIYDDLAKEYIKNLLVEKNMIKTMQGIGRYNTSYIDKNKQSILTKSSRKKIGIGFSILIIGMVGFTIYWFVSNFQTNSKKIQVINNIADFEKRIDENTEDNKILAENNTISYDDYINIEKKLDNMKSELDFYRNKYDILAMLNDVEKSLNDRDYEKAASALLDMKNISFDDNSKIKFDKLWTDINANAKWTIYNQGNRLYKDGKYKEALPKLIIASEFNPSPELMPWIIYQIGICYKETNEKTNAIVFFQKVEDNYPKSQYAANSKRMINQIENK